MNDTNDAAVGITVSGNANAVFWGDVTNTRGLFRVSAGSSATFFGGFAGNGISGGGDVYLEADITPGSSPGLAEFGGNVHFGEVANLAIELAGTAKGSEYDAIDIAGSAALDGTFGVSLLEGLTPAVGDVFEILTAAGGISGTFAAELLPGLTGNLFWDVVYSGNSLSLQVVAPGLSGDYNGNGTVDAVDYVVWRKNPDAFGGDAGYNTWRANFGSTAGAGAAGTATAAVPEPATVFIAVLAGLASAAARRRACRSLQ